MGYLLRLAELNRFDTPSWMLQLAQINSYVRSSLSFNFNISLNLSPLAKLTGVDEAELFTLLYAPVDHLRSPMGDYFVFGSPLPQYMIRVRRPKVCPGCLREENYARRIWELSPVTACPVHKCLLLEECPNCLKRLSWIRSSISCCKCEFDWRVYDVPIVGASELKVVRQIHALCKLPSAKDCISEDARNNPLHEVKPKDFLSALFFVASQYAGGMDTKGKHLAPSTGSSQLHALLCKAISVFEDWPNNYFAFLDWRRLQADDAQLARGLHRDFAGYKSALYAQLASEQLDFMRSAFEEYLVARWDGGYTTHLRRLSETARRNGKYSSRREAKELLKVGVKGIDRLIAAGKLSAVVQHKGKARLILIERESLCKLKYEFDQSLYLKQVEKLLGISYPRVSELVEHGLLNPLRGPAVDGCGDWSFSKEEVKCLFARIKEKVKPLLPMVNSDMVNLLMALRKLNRVNIRMGQFVKSILGGEISPCGEGEKSGLASFLFSKKQLANYAGKQRRMQMGEVFCAKEVAKRLSVTQDAIYFLTKRGILPSQTRTREGSFDLLISKDDLEWFESAYFLPAKVAARLGTISGYLTGLLITEGVQPISGPKVDGGRQYVFKKSDLAGMQVEDLIAAARSKRLILERRSLRQVS